jgi:alkylation response protein AidB-like acyl-CoA dehydrogenase
MVGSDETESVLSWLRAERPTLSSLPPPGHGHTAQRWRCFTSIARCDLSRARLAEGHADAVAIMSELDRAELIGEHCWGVWAAEPQRLQANCRGSRWVLTGEKRWCSGSVALDRALVTATAPDGPRLFAVDTAFVEVVDGSWPSIGMAATASDTIRFDLEVPADHVVGAPHDYVRRPGFWFGAMGVAACWYGGTVGVADRLMTSIRAREREEGAMWRSLGRVRVHLDTVADRLRAAADHVDRDRETDLDDLRVRALSLRLAAEGCARAVLDEVGVACGAAALAFDEVHARRVADLSLYIRQLDRHHDELELGRATEHQQW